jgi:hypothetical protein
MGAASGGCRSNYLPRYLMKDFEGNVTNDSPQNTPTVVRALSSAEIVAVETSSGMAQAISGSLLPAVHAIRVDPTTVMRIE